MVEKEILIHGSPLTSPTMQLNIKTRITAMACSFILIFFMWGMVHSQYTRFAIAEITGLFASLFLFFLSIGWIGLTDIEEDLLYLIPAIFVLLTYVILKGYLVVGIFHIEGIELETTEGIGSIVAGWFLKHPFVVSFLTLSPFVVAGGSRYDPESSSLRSGLAILIMLVIFWPGMISWGAPSLNSIIGQSVLFNYHLVHIIVIFLVLPFTLLILYKGIPMSYLGLKLPPIKRFLFILSAWIPALGFLFVIQTITYGFPIKFYTFKEWLIKIIYVTFFMSFPMELMFRSLLIGVLSKVWSHVFGKDVSMPIFTLLFSSIFFAIFHYWGGPYAFVSSFIFGIVFGGAFLYTRSLLTSVLLHTLVLLMGPIPF